MNKCRIAVLLMLVLTASLWLPGMNVAATQQAPQTVPGGCPVESRAFHQCALEKAKTFQPPRLADGTPDFRGYWTSRHNGAVWDLEPRPGQGSLVPAATGVIVDAGGTAIPYQPAALARKTALKSKPYDDPTAHCARTGTPRTSFTNYGLKITQPQGHVVILYENFHDFSVIPTDGRPPLPDSIKLWHPDAIGRWDGNTLVVDYTNFNGKQWMDQSGNFQTEKTHMIERYTMIDRDTIHYEATIEDPTIYTRPWKLAIAYTRNTQENYYQVEFACHEGERDMQHFTEEFGKGQSDVFIESNSK